MQLLSRNFRSSHPCAHQVLSVSFCARVRIEQCTNFRGVAAAASSAGTAVTLSVASAAAAAAFVTAVVPACAPACTSLDICAYYCCSWSMFQMEFSHVFFYVIFFLEHSVILFPMILTLIRATEENLIDRWIDR